MRRFAILALAATAVSAIAIPSATSGGDSAGRTYLVLYSDGASVREARAEIERLGGTILRQDRAIGYARVSTRNTTFLKGVMRSDVLAGAARDRIIGTTRPGLRPKDDIERVTAAREASLGQRGIADAQASQVAEPLADLQWDMEMIHATAGESQAVQDGDPGVLVGIMDTGIDASHPDIAENFSFELSRNFTTDIPLIDGKCSQEPDKSCSDPATVDENSHGTHVAGTVASPVNGLGMAGVAPDVTLVNIRAGQDSGFFFLEPTIQAMRYAGDNGIDVVNMSFFTDPWLFNCPTDAPATDPETGEPVDSPEAQMEQQTIITLTQEAVNYARARGVTFIAAAGNSHLNLGAATKLDEISPDFPPGSEYPRLVTNSCLSVPTETQNVLSVSALGPSTAKADYSNYGREQITVSAPGGYFRDFFGTPQHRVPENEVLGPYPEAIAREAHDIDGSGRPRTPFVVRDCANGTCAYYQFIQGTSMASPHAVGVAALIVSQFGTPDAAHGGLTLSPATVEQILKDSATEHACPKPRLVDYTIVGRDESFNAFCGGNASFNDFYGHGIVNALSAVGG